jgi:hypothetical protein
MNAAKKKRAAVGPLVFAICAAFALELAGCKDSSSGSATTEPAAAAAGVDTNSAAATPNRADGGD